VNSFHDVDDQQAKRLWTSHRHKNGIHIPELSATPATRYRIASNKAAAVCIPGQ
jgi:hypothetical protein